MLVLAVLTASAVAWADKIDELGQKLRSDPDYKVRLSAALNLGKLGDRRAVAPLVDGLGDGDKTVRGVSAAALGKLVDRSVAPDLVDRAVAGLERAASSDGDAFVRAEAQRSLETVRALRGSQAPPPPGARPVYIEIGPMADTTKRAPSVPTLMRQRAMTTLARHAPGFVTRWPNGHSPSDSELKKSGATGFYIDGTLVALNVSRTPPHVACTISLVLATYPQKSLFGFMKGGAEVDAAGSSEASIAEATSDCVGAVVEDLVSSKLVPTIQARVP